MSEYNGPTRNQLNILKSLHLYLSLSHRKALASLYYGIEKGDGVQLVLAEEGLGKTALLQHLRGRLQRYARPVYFCAVNCKIPGYLDSIIEDLSRNQSDRGVGSERKAIFNAGTRDEPQMEQRLVLLVDDAEKLDDHELDRVIALNQREAFKEKRLHIILAGRPSLSDRLADSKFAQNIEQVWLAEQRRIEIKGYSLDRRKITSEGRESKSKSVTSSTIAIRNRDTQRIKSSTTWIGEIDLLDQSQTAVVPSKDSDQYVPPSPAFSSSSFLRRNLPVLMSICFVLGVITVWYEHGLPWHSASLFDGYKSSSSLLLPFGTTDRNTSSKEVSKDRKMAPDSSKRETGKAETFETHTALRKEGNSTYVLPAVVIPDKNTETSRLPPDSPMSVKATSIPTQNVATNSASAERLHTTSDSTPTILQNGTAHERPEPPRQALTAAISHQIRIETDVGDDYMRLGQYEKAIMFYKDALALSPDSEWLQLKIKRAQLAKTAEDQVLK